MKRRIVAATITGQGLPLEVVKGLICRDFGWTFEELRQQPLDEVFTVWGALAFYEEQMAKRAERRRG